MLVRNIMTKDVFTLDESDMLTLAEDIMALGHIRHLPVVRGDRLVGIVTQRDILRASLSTLIRHKPEDKTAFSRGVVVSEIMTRDVITISPNATVNEAAEAMADRKIGCLPVVEEGDKLVGLVTETDILNHVARRSKQRRKAKG